MANPKPATKPLTKPMVDGLASSIDALSRTMAEHRRAIEELQARIRDLRAKRAKYKVMLKRGTYEDY